MRNLKLSFILITIHLSFSCVAQDSSDDVNTPNNQQQPVVLSDNTTPAEASSEFPDTISETTHLYYAINKAALDVNLEEGERPSIQICDFSTPLSWGSRTALATVTQVNYFVEDDCVEGNRTLRMHNEAAVEIHSTLSGPPASEGETTILFRIDNHNPTLRVGEHILVHYLSQDDRNFALNTVLVEGNPAKFEQRPKDGEGRILATPENKYINLPNTYGELSYVLSSAEENHTCTPSNVNSEGKQLLIDRFFEKPTTCNNKTSTSNEAPPQDEAPANGDGD